MSASTDLLGTHLRAIYDEACFRGDGDALRRGEEELRAIEAQLSLARGRFLHAQFLRDRADRPEELTHFIAAAALFSALGDVRGEADATFWVTTYHQVVRGDQEEALPLLERAERLAAEADDPLVMSYVARHLAFVDLAAGDLDRARARFEESTRLRRQLDFVPGVAAALLPLAHLAALGGDLETASRVLDEADRLCEAHQLNAVSEWTTELRAEHDLPRRA